MSKKFLPILIVAGLMLAAAVFAVPGNAKASPLLGITPTPTDTPTEPPTDTPTPSITVTITEETPTDTPTPTNTPTPTEPTVEKEQTPKPKPTEVVLLPETGEFPIDPSQGMQFFFGLTVIFLIGLILFRTVRGAKIKK